MKKFIIFFAVILLASCGQNASQNETQSISENSKTENIANVEVSKNEEKNEETQEESWNSKVEDYDYMGRYREFVGKYNVQFRDEVEQFLNMEKVYDLKNNFSIAVKDGYAELKYKDETLEWLSYRDFQYFELGINIGVGELFTLGASMVPRVDGGVYKEMFLDFGSEYLEKKYKELLEEKKFDMQNMVLDRYEIVKNQEDEQSDFVAVTDRSECWEGDGCTKHFLVDIKNDEIYTNNGKGFNKIDKVERFGDIVLVSDWWKKYFYKKWWESLVLEDVYIPDYSLENNIFRGVKVEYKEVDGEMKGEELLIELDFNKIFPQK